MQQGAIRVTGLQYFGVLAEILVDFPTIKSVVF